MLKLNASYSKKVPAEGEYSSQSYHASIEVELPDGLNQSQLQTRIHETFALVKESIEAELHGNVPSQQGCSTPKTAHNQAVPQPVRNRSSSCSISQGTKASRLPKSRLNMESLLWSI